MIYGRSGEGPVEKKVHGRVFTDYKDTTEYRGGPRRVSVEETF